MKIDEKIPNAPKYLGKNGKREWKRLGPKNWEAGTINDLNLQVFAAYCRAYDDYISAIDALKVMKEKMGPGNWSDGFMVKTTNGNFVQNPLVGVINQASDRMCKRAAELGLQMSEKKKGKKQERQDRAKSAGAGKFAPSAPPLRAVK